MLIKDICSVQHGISSSTLEASFDTLNVKKFDGKKLFYTYCACRRHRLTRHSEITVFM